VTVILGDLIAAWSPSFTLLFLILAGHLLGDFLFQSRRMAEGKGRDLILLQHVGAVSAAQLALLLPFLGVEVVLGVLVIGALHWLIDRTKARWPWEEPGSLGLFLLDQAAHLVVLAGVFAALVLFAPPPLHLQPEVARVFALGALVLGVFAFNWTGGGAIVSGALAGLSPTLETDEEESSGVAGSGRVIGILERTLTLVLILAGQWAAIMLLLTAKSIARFEELKQRRFAEYYLVGTLTSLLVAILSGLALRFILFGEPFLP
jgi:hypothetical protein